MHHNLPPPSLQVWSCGVVSGAQTTPRAELFAALQAVGLGYYAGQVPLEVVTDCSYVVHTLTLLQSGLTQKALLASANMDILLLFKEVWYEQVVVSKVRSHQQVQEQATVEQQWRVLGNLVVDKACDAFRESDLSVVYELQAEVLQGQQAQQGELTAVYDYYLALHAATNRMRHNEVQDGPTITRVALDDLEAGTPPGLLQWQDRRRQQGPQSPLPLPACKVFRSCTWGPDSRTGFGTGRILSSGTRPVSPTQALQHWNFSATLWWLQFLYLQCR